MYRQSNRSESLIVHPQARTVRPLPHSANLSTSYNYIPSSIPMVQPLSTQQHKLNNANMTTNLYRSPSPPSVPMVQVPIPQQCGTWPRRVRPAITPGVPQLQAPSPQQHHTRRLSNEPVIEHSRRRSNGVNPYRKTSAAVVRTQQEIGKPSWLPSTNALHPVKKLPPLNRVSTASQAENPFDDHHGVESQGADHSTFWTCPRCRSAWKKSSERLMNIQRTGRYFFECGNINCLTSLVVIRNKSNGFGRSVSNSINPRQLTNMADTVDELQVPSAEGDLPVYGKNETTSTAKASKKRQGLKISVRNVGRAVKDGLAKFTGPWYDPLISDSDTATVDCRSVVTSVVTQDSPGNRLLSRLSNKRANCQHSLQLPGNGEPQTNARHGSTQTTLSKAKCARASIPTHDLGTQFHLPTYQKSILSCQLCSATFSGDDRGEEQLRQHIARKHRDQEGQQSAQQQYRELIECCHGRGEEEPMEDDDQDDGELFPACKFCKKTFSTDFLCAKHEAEQHPGQVKEFPKCRVCEANFENMTLRAMHEKKEHSHWYELNIGG